MQPICHQMLVPLESQEGALDGLYPVIPMFYWIYKLRFNQKSGFHNPGGHNFRHKHQDKIKIIEIKFRKISRLSTDKFA